MSRGSAGVVLYPSKPPWSIQVTTLFGAPLCIHVPATQISSPTRGWGGRGEENSLLMATT